jgi:hypothetical protein
MNRQQFVLLADFDNIASAHSMRVLLEASGLEARVHGDFSAEIGSVDRATLLVRSGDLELAQKIVTEVPAASEILIPEWICDCGQTVDEGFQVCWSCGQSCPDETT